jgi:hypothetical protein
MIADESKQLKSLYIIAFYATIIMLVIIPLQILVFIISEIPTTTSEWFNLFNTNKLFGFFHADFFILINNLLIAIIYLAFYHSLKDTNKGIIQHGILLGLIGIAAYISSKKTFELLRLSHEYYQSEDIIQKQILESAGKATLLGWQGTAFDTYYVLNGIALFCISIVMYKNSNYTKATAIWGLIAAIFMVIPSTAGLIGLICSLLSLIPWYIFSIKFCKVFYRIGKKI